MTEFSIPAPDLARLTHNALAFMPARSAVKVCRIEAGYFESVPTFEITATDLFTVGRDTATLEALPDLHASIDLSREDLQALDKAARAAKKEDVRLKITQADGLVFNSEAEELYCLDRSHKRTPVDLWDRCDELLMRLEGAPNQPIPEFLTIDPKMLSAFGKVKPANGKECIADLFLRGSEGQILVKIGATFTGAIMPVDREEAGASEHVGREGLWGMAA